MQVTAAVVRTRGGPFVPEIIDLAAPRPDEVLVRIVACGVCATDLHIRGQEYPVPLPVVAGHEGAGVVEEVGAAVDDLAVGDQVLLSYPFCGACPSCRAGNRPYCRDGFALSFGGSRLDGTNALRFRGEATTPVLHGHIFQQSSFATHAVAPARSAVRVAPTADLTTLAPLGCGVQTGAGTVLNALRVRPGSSVGVLGVGSVGLSAVMAAVVAGAESIVAVDRRPPRLDIARQLGATDVVDSTSGELVDQLKTLADGGLDYIVDTTAQPDVLSDALQATAMTGTVALVGGAPTGTRVSLDMNTLLNGRTVRGVIQGDSNPREFLPRLIDLHETGCLPLERLITHYEFSDIEQAVRDMADGAAIKPVLLMQG
ncbi:NAD(P)-dependent alcohol dehydrogenase [Nocardioides hungaricus]